MDINEDLHPHGAPDGASETGGVPPDAVDDLQDVPATTLRLARAIGARLRAPLATRRRDELAGELAAAAVAAASSSTDPAAAERDRVAVGDASPSRPGARRARPAWRPGSSRPSTRARSLRRLSAAAAALVVLAGGVGVLTRVGDDLPVLDLATGAGVGPATAMDAAGTREGAMMEPAMGDMMWWVPTTYRFQLADGVALPAGRAPAWRLVRPADLAAAAAPIAATLGLPALAASEWDASTLWSESDAAGSLWVAPSGDWYFSGPAHLWPVWDCPTVDAGVDAGDGRTEPAPADGPGSSVGECTPPAPPVGVPDAERARVLAVEFLATVGHRDVRIIDVWADEWGAWVTAEPTMSGVPAGSGLTVSVGFGAQGRLSSANGTLATVERIGEYPTIDAASAIARLEDDLNAWQLSGPVARPMPADVGGLESRGSGTDPDAPVSDRDGDADTPVTILPVPDADAPLPGPDGEVEPVELTVTIVSIELVTSLAWTSTGDMLLLPHYRLVDSDGGWWFVVAVADRYLAR
jgi:hypothetical protein